jgi:hypothetical protein
MDDEIKTSGGPAKNTPSDNKTNKAINQTKDQGIDFTIDEYGSDNQSSKGPHDNWLDKLKSYLPQTKKGWAIVGIGLAILIVALYFIFLGKTAKATVTKTKPKAIISDLVPSTLTGLQVSPSVNKTPVTGVMVENSTYARPQSGLSQAGVVFEALAEGGVTRFLALYQDTAPANVGPIRSVRPYYLQWALGFDASIAHVGGSPDALNDIATWNVKDLNQFYNGSYYHRISSREAPHNVYTAISDLNTLEAKKGYNSVNFTGFPRKTAAPSTKPAAETINLNLSSADYNDTYGYDKTTNTYNRSEDGTPMIDANTNKQVSPTVVIAMVVPWSQGALDSSGAYYSVYQTIGSGQADIFEDGNVVVGHWSKTSNTSQIQFTDANNQPVKLDAGQTWITAIKTSGEVSYSP